MEYEYVLHTDISDCYGSIYTHSIAWSLHTKVTAKQRRNDRSLIGNVIDKHLQDMAYGQTNGIPQGSVLMDFISEIVLGYADLELTHRLEEQSLTEYHILRYRDDYRIYSNNPQTAELILKHITEILIDLNMRLNAQKTLVSNNIIQVSIKPDKLYWNLSKKSSKSLQSHLLLIHDLATKFSNSGSLTKALDRYYDKISSCKETSENINVLISILVDIVFNNPRTYPIASAILSELLLFISDKYEKDLLMKKIVNRFAKIPNTGHLQIWLQRVTIKIDRGRKYSEILCKKVNNAKIEIWNSKWLNDDFKNLINSERIVNEQKIEDLSISIKPEEVKIFGVKSEYTYSE